MKPLYLDANGRRLFCLYFPAARKARKRLIVLPAFAEEMNKARRLLAILARSLAALDVAVLSFDLFGTGDSAGRFEEASWEIWREDVRAAWAWLKDETPGASPGVLAVRTGALFLEDTPLLKGARVVLWQPVLEGAAFLRFFLRQRSLASKFAGQSEPVNELKNRALSGEAIEVMGYLLSPTMVRDLEKRCLSAKDFDSVRSIDVIEFKRGEQYLSDEFSAWSECVEATGLKVGKHVCDVAPFWASHQIVVPADAIDLTRKVFLTN